jgi:hypothetical protein
MSDLSKNLSLVCTQGRGCRSIDASSLGRSHGYICIETPMNSWNNVPSGDEAERKGRHLRLSCLQTRLDGRVGISVYTVHRGEMRNLEGVDR